MKQWMRRYGAAALFLLLGVFRLVIAGIDGDLTEALLGVGYLIAAVLLFFRIPDRAIERSRKRMKAKYAGRAIPPPHDSPPRWSSPDNPPGWYLNPATGAPGYWTELGWRGSEPS
jgi:hypothetical protein